MDAWRHLLQPVRSCNSPVSYNSAVESLKMPIVFKPNLYEYPKDNFGLKTMGTYKWIKMTGFDWFIAT